MKKEAKLLSAISILPVLADFLEDAGLTQRAKQKANDLIKSIRSFDMFFMNDANSEEVIQQDNIKLAFRQWVKENFN